MFALSLLQGGRSLLLSMPAFSARQVARSVGALASLLVTGCAIEQGGIADPVPLEETGLPSSDDGTNALAIDTALPEVGSDTGSITDFGSDRGGRAWLRRTRRLGCSRAGLLH